MTAFAAEKTREERVEFQQENEESAEPNREAEKTCAAELGTYGANAAIENIIRLQKEKLEKKPEPNKHIRENSIEGCPRLRSAWDYERNFRTPSHLEL